MISALPIFLILGLLQQSQGLSNVNTGLEPLITPHFFQTMNPHLHNAIANTLMEEEINIPAQKISVPFLGTIQMNVSSFRIQSLNWHPASGLYYRNKSLEYWAELNSEMFMDYVTNSRWILRSGRTKVQVSELRIAIRLRFAFDDGKQVIEPIFDKVEVDLQRFDIWSNRSWIHWVTSNFQGIVKHIVVGQIEHTIKLQLPAVLEQTSKVHFMTADGPYHSKFTSVPHFTDSGILFELGLFRGGAKNHSIISKRSFEGFERTPKSRYTDLQPLLTNTLLQEIKPIIFESINSALTNLDLDASYLVPVPLLAPIGLNLTYFYVDENEVQWHPSTDIIFIQDALHVDIGISFKVYTKYQTTSRFILPNATTNATVENLRIITDVGFNLINETLSPDFKNLNITIQKLDVSSSTSSVSFLVSFFNKLILSKSSEAITSIVKHLVPGIVSEILQSDIHIKNMGTFKTFFLKAPEISKHGMLVDMTVAKVD